MARASIPSVAGQAGGLRPPSLRLEVSAARARQVAGLVLIAGAILMGVAIAAGPLSALLAAAVVGATWLLIVGRRIVALFLGSLAILITGYAFLGRGLAHVGVGPVYIGEVVLFLAVPATLVSLRRARFEWVHVFLLLFMAWGAARTIPYIGQYNISALRDSVTWSYGFFAIAVSFTLTADRIPRLVAGFRRLVVPFVVWVPIGTVIWLAFGGRVPTAPGSDVPIVYFKAGDAGCLLAAAAAFVLTGLWNWGRTRQALTDVFLWVCWLVGFVLAAAISRGGMLAAMMAGFSGLTIRRFGRWLMPATIGLVLFTGAWLANPQVDLGLVRSVSVDQLVQNVTSIFTNQNGTETNDTKEWRLEWWNKIVGYTIDGPYFWTGKGYGINLADCGRIPGHLGRLAAGAAQHPSRDPGPLRCTGPCHVDRLQRGVGGDDGPGPLAVLPAALPGSPGRPDGRARLLGGGHRQRVLRCLPGRAAGRDPLLERHRPGHRPGAHGPRRQTDRSGHGGRGGSGGIGRYGPGRRVSLGQPEAFRGESPDPPGDPRGEATRQMDHHLEGQPQGPPTARWTKVLNLGETEETHRRPGRRGVT